MSFQLATAAQPGVGGVAPGIRRGGALPTSLDFGFGATTIGSNNQILQEQNQFTDLSRTFAGAAQQSLGQAGQPLVDLAGAGITPGGIAGQGQAVQQQFGNLQQAIGGAAQQQFDPTAFANTQFDRLQSLAGRGEEIAANRVAGNLFSRGRLGAEDTATGAAFEGLARGQGQARTGRALQATQLANQEAQRLFAQGQTGVQNQFGLLQQLQGGQAQGFEQLLGGSQLNLGSQLGLGQQALQFGTGAGQVLDPNFQALQQTIGLRLADQGIRADATIAKRQSDVSRRNANLDAFGNLVGGLAGNL